MRVKIGPFNCLKRPGDSDKTNVVILHGFGADANDLFPLAEYLDPDQKWTFYFPDALLEVPIGPGFMGRGWFPISVRELETGIDFTQVRPPGLDESSAAVSELIFHLNSDRLVLGGFSQGAMVSTEVAMNQPEDVAGLVLYSTTLLDEAGWAKKAPGLKGKPFIQSHGALDTVLPLAAAQRLYHLLKSAGAEGSLLTFSGAHEIPLPVLKKTQEFLNQL
ncbi:MAG: alpha/beta hydrolase [Bdellovibrionales bacterium]